VQDDTTQQLDIFDELAALEAAEQWRAIAGWEGFYEVSDCGRVRSVARTITNCNGGLVNYRSRMLKLSPVDPIRTPHLRVVLRKQGSRQDAQVHRLVLETFVGPCPEGMEACHWNDDPTDNRVDNLRWASKSDNRHDSLRNIDKITRGRTHCTKGHPYDQHNTVFKSDGRRICASCLSAMRVA
jgi:hypothetical protein